MNPFPRWASLWQIKYKDDKKSHDVKRRKWVPFVTEVHARREHLLDVMASYSSISDWSKRSKRRTFFFCSKIVPFAGGVFTVQRQYVWNIPLFNQSWFSREAYFWSRLVRLDQEDKIRFHQKNVNSSSSTWSKETPSVVVVVVSEGVQLCYVWLKYGDAT